MLYNEPIAAKDVYESSKCQAAVWLTAAVL